MPPPSRFPLIHNPHTLLRLTDEGPTAFNAYREKMQQALADIAE